MAEAGLKTAKLQIEELQEKLRREASAEKLRLKKPHLLTPGSKKKKNRRSRERLIVARSEREVVEQECNLSLVPVPPFPDLAAEGLADAQEDGVASCRLCAPARWVSGMLSAFSTGNLHNSDRPAKRYDPPGKWTEGDEIEYLAVDLINGEKTMKWVRGTVSAVRSRVVRDVARRELRVTYYTNSHHQETTYWMVPSDLRLRASR
jgi:hypothetical protein